MSKRIVGAVVAFVVVEMVAFAVLLSGMLWMDSRNQAELIRNQAKFIEKARKSDSRVAKMYELYPQAEARFNDGNRYNHRGAFAPITQTFTLCANVGNGYELNLYRGIGPDGTTIVEGAYSVQSPTNQMADLTEAEFDALLDAKGDLSVLKTEIWQRQPLPTKHLGARRP